MSDSSIVGVGVLGLGTVGGALVERLTVDAEAIASRTGVRLGVRRVAVRDLERHRSTVDDTILTTDPHEVVDDPAVHIVVELIGGIDPAHQLVERALRAGKPVVTANKELIADAGAALTLIAAEAGVDLLYEAAVGGGIPIIRPLRESLAGERIRRVVGIVNGTTNYVLTRMTDDGAEYAAALAEAQREGFAESDPTADVDGHDAAAKAAIVANVAFGGRFVAADVYREGIAEVTAADIALAARLGHVVKLLAVVERDPAEPRRVGVRVHPTMVPVDHPLASVRLSFNALFVEGENVGELMFYGRGAGGAPTASAVLGDLVDAAHNRSRGSAGSVPEPGHIAPWSIDEQSSPVFVGLDVDDRPGVLAAVAGVFGDHGVSIRSMEQLGLRAEARLVFITHAARERDVRATLRDLRALPAVRRVGNVLRVLERA